jgi:integrase
MYVRSPKFIVKFSAKGNGRKRNWYIVGYPGEKEANGRRKRRVFWFETERAAKNEAERLNLSLNRFGPEAEAMNVTQRLDAWRALQMIGDVATLTQAVEFYLHEKDIKLKSKSVGQIIDEYYALNERKFEKGEVSQIHLNHIKTSNRRLRDTFGDRFACDVKRPEIVAWLDAMDVKSASRNTYRTYAHSIFSFALLRGYCTSNPVAGIPNIRQQQEIGILTVDEFRRLLNCADPYLIPYYALGGFAGLRPSEVERLKWEAFDWGSNPPTIKVENVKNKHSRSPRYRYVDVTPNLAAWLEPFKEWSGNVRIISLSCSKKAARKAAGIDDWPHDALRHSYGSYMLAQTQNSDLVASQMGHSSSAMIYSNYRKLVKREQAEEFFSIYPQRQLCSKYPGVIIDALSPIIHPNGTSSGKDIAVESVGGEVQRQLCANPELVS